MTISVILSLSSIYLFRLSFYINTLKKTKAYQEFMRFYLPLCGYAHDEHKALKYTLHLLCLNNFPR